MVSSKHYPKSGLGNFDSWFESNQSETTSNFCVGAKNAQNQVFVSISISQGNCTWLCRKHYTWQKVDFGDISRQKRKLLCSRFSQTLLLITSFVSVRIRRFFKLRSNEQHRWTSFGMQHQNFRCKTRILKQTCILFSVWSQLKKEKIHLQVQNILQYGCCIFQTFLVCAMGPSLSANKKSFEYSLNWNVYTVLHIAMVGRKP